MRRKRGPFLLAGLICAWVLFQTGAPCAAQTRRSPLRTFNETRNQIHAKSMLVFGLWSLASFTGAAIQYPTSEGRTRYFHELSTFWSAANLGRAGWEVWRARTAQNTLSAADSRQAQRHTVRWRLWNVGFDVLTIAGGAYLISRGNDATTNGERLQGYGAAMVLQGGVQLAFNSAILLLHHLHGRQLPTILQNFALSANQMQFSLHF